MPDYNIYIHAIGTGGATSDNPTVPWSQREGGGAFSQTQSQGGSGDFIGTAKKALSFAQNPDSIVSSAVSAVGKAIPAVILAAMVVNLAKTIVTNVVEFNTITSGDYRNQVALNNYKAIRDIVFNPVSSIINHYKQNITWEVANQKQRAQRDLLGDSVLNSYTNRGV